MHTGTKLMQTGLYKIHTHVITGKRFTTFKYLTDLTNTGKNLLNTTPINNDFQMFE